MNIKWMLVALALVPSISFACPAIDRVPDIDCNGSLVISILGDSLVYGIGDAANHNKGGYVLRLSSKLKDAAVENLGIPGLRTKELLGLLDDAFRKNKRPVLKGTLSNSDIVILDLGRNDRWLMGPPLAVYRNLKRAVSVIKSRTLAITGNEPLVLIAAMMLPNRGSQGPWVQELNALIVKGNRPSKLPTIRFDLVSKRLLTEDRIHPTSAGYSALTSVIYKYLTTTLPATLAALEQPSS